MPGKYRIFILSLFCLSLLCLNCSSIYAEKKIEMPQESILKEADKVAEIDLPEYIPQGNTRVEENNTNGIDDDNDGVIDESAHIGTCMIIIYNTNDYPNGEWELKVDGISKGVYRKGKARFWDLMLPVGKHKVNIESVFTEGNSANYAVEFQSCKVIKGPPTNPFNASPNPNYSWIVEVQEQANNN
jgi:hypothetical protein